MKTLGLALFAAFTLAGCSSHTQELSAENVAAMPTPSLPTPTITPAPVVMHAVVVRITGVLDKGMTQTRPWLIKAGIGDQKVPLPYVQNYSKATGEEISVSAQNVDWDFGKLQIDIEVDGKPLDRTIGPGVPLLSASYRIPPPGATAACMDRTFSYSAQRQGSCSDHGGVYNFYFADGSKDETEGER